MKFKWPQPRRLYHVGESNRVFMRRIAEAYGAKDSEAVMKSVMACFEEQPIRAETTERVCDALKQAAEQTR